MLLTGGEHEDWWPDEALLWLTPLGGFQTWCRWSSVTLPVRVTVKTCEWQSFRFLWSLKDQICIGLMCSQQTVAQLWQWSTLTNTSLNCGEQIVSTLILSNVCLSFFWAAHEKFSDIVAMPEVTSHHIFSSYEADRCRMLRRVTQQNPLFARERIHVNALFTCAVWERVCQRVCAITCARVKVFMIMCVQHLMMVQVFPLKWSGFGVNCLNKTEIYWTSEASF